MEVGFDPSDDQHPIFVRVQKDGLVITVRMNCSMALVHADLLRTMAERAKAITEMGGAS
jgi:hypothetical protein